MTGRRVVTGVTLLVLVALLVAGAVVGWRALSAPLPGSADDPARTPRPGCDDRLAKGDVVRTGDVVVSVLNAGSRSGLASQTLDQLTARGFVPGDLDNAPESLAGVRFVRVLADDRNDPAARLVALQFGRDTLIARSTEDLGRGVDVVVGNQFVGLVEDAPRRLRATAPGSGC